MTSNVKIKTSDTSDTKNAIPPYLSQKVYEHEYSFSTLKITVLKFIIL